MDELKPLDELNKPIVATIPSGYKSDDSDNELFIVEPIIRHPERKELCRAIDPETGWKTWVEFVPAQIEPPPVDEAEEALAAKQTLYTTKLRDLEKRNQLVLLGVATKEELKIAALIQEIRTLATELKIL